MFLYQVIHNVIEEKILLIDSHMYLRNLSKRVNELYYIIPPELLLEMHLFLIFEIAHT